MYLLYGSVIGMFIITTVTTDVISSVEPFFNFLLSLCYIGTLSSKKCHIHYYLVHPKIIASDFTSVSAISVVLKVGSAN